MADLADLLIEPRVPRGLGWYSAWVAIMATAFGITNIVKFHDSTLGVLWLQWSVLWALFWLVLGLGITRLTPARDRRAGRLGAEAPP